MPKDQGKEKIYLRVPVPYACRERSNIQRASGSGVMDVDGDRSQSDDADQPLVVSKEYCCFCGDLMGTKMHICCDCGAYVCEQTKRYGRGCIYLGTVQADAAFRCILCHAKHWRGQKDRPKSGLPYGFLAHGGRKRAKLTWPLVLVNMTLSTSFESLIADSLRIELKHHYLASPQSLRLVDITLKGGGQNVALKNMEPARKHLVHSMESMVPANVFIVADTHADTLTGGLQWAGGVTGVQTAPASEVLSEFCGKPFMDKMKQAAEAARKFVPPDNPGWYRDSPFYRGGWRGLLLATCGPAVRIRNGFLDLRELVVRDQFDFVLAFGGSSTISNYVRDGISRAIEGVGVDNTGNIWTTISQVVGRDLKLLQMNSVVLIYRERGGEVRCRQIGLHSPPLRAWGVDFSACAKEGCRPAPYDFDIRDSDGRVRITCRLCHWQSTALRASDLKGLLFGLSSTVPDVYWHEYPPSMELQDAFVRVTKAKAAAGKADGGVK